MNSWKVLDRKELFSDPPWVRLSVEHVETSRGARIENFYRVDLPEYVTIVAYTAEGQIVLEELYKHAVGRVMTAFPAGYLEPGEDPIEAAKREFLEETGYAAEEWRSLGSFVVDGNRGCGHAHLVVAHGARLVQKPEWDDTEEIKVVLLDPREVAKALTHGTFRTLSNAAGAFAALALSGGIPPRNV